MAELIKRSVHKLYDKWTFWAHLPHDTDWSLNSYQKLVSISSLEEAVTLNNIIPEEMICNCMLFVMRDGINPLWEDSHNKDGGSFSFKIDNNQVNELWQEWPISVFIGCICGYLLGFLLWCLKCGKKIIQLCKHWFLQGCVKSWVWLPKEGSSVPKRSPRIPQGQVRPRGGPRAAKRSREATREATREAKREAKREAIREAKIQAKSHEREAKSQKPSQKPSQK